MTAAEVLQIVAAAFTPALVLVLAWFAKDKLKDIKSSFDAIKESFDEMKKKMDEYGKSQNECQVHLPKIYQTREDAFQYKQDIDAQLSKQWGKIDDHGNRIARVETLLNEVRR